MCGSVANMHWKFWCIIIIIYIKYHMYFYYICNAYRVAYTNINHKFHFRIHSCQRWNYSNVCVCVYNVHAFVCVEIFHFNYSGMEWNEFFEYLPLSNYEYIITLKVKQCNAQFHFHFRVLPFFVWDKKNDHYLLKY